ncbi:MAG: hypothetical protein B7O98_01165 [Zestosphaera tikiterensis]|uniref:Uncharacterized protein n=1 Tax=Zestosphaera tikiterensis TaxID=1973259 RepID=A0A2R7Y6B7_9CREN|nr:MAG: hypothetical protein B7O98_01165 [Zestosphaera tikiterensis]
MSVVYREFNNVAEFMKSIDDELGEHRKKLGELLRKLEELRVKAEQEKKIKTVLSKLGVPETAPQNIVEMKNVKLIMNPTPAQEISNLEAAIESLNAKVSQLTAIKKDLEVLGGLDVEVKLTVIYVEGLPKTVLIRFT